jgi:hypothetical protein
MNSELLTDIARQTGGSFFVDVFKTHQERYALQLLSEVYQVFQKQQFDGYAIDFWDDIVQHFQLDNNEIEKLSKRNS